VDRLWKVRLDVSAMVFVDGSPRSRHPSRPC